MSVVAGEQTALALLQHTSIPRRVFALSYQEEEGPTTCLILPVVGKSGRFDLFVSWQPNSVIGALLPRSIVLSSISDTSASDDSFTVTTYRDRFGRPVSLSPSIKAAFARASLDQAARQCEVLANGQFELASTKSS